MNIIYKHHCTVLGLSKRLPMQEMQRLQFSPWVGKIPWNRQWQLTPVFLPVEFHGQRILMGYSPWGHKELYMTEHMPDNMVLKAYKMQTVKVSISQGCWENKMA